MDLGLAGRSCVVTGASRGIGRATARMLAAEGADVLLVARGANDLGDAVEDCRGAAAASGGQAEAITPRRHRRRRRASGSLDACERHFGKLDVLVNNAGTARWRDLDDVPDEDWYAAWELNVMAPLRLIRAAAPGDDRARLGTDRQRRLDRRQAALGLDARVLGREGGAALALAPLRRPPRRRGVLVNAICPGPTKSEMWMEEGGLLDQSKELSGAASRDEALEAAGAKRPIGRHAEVDEIAAAIVFLCSERSSYTAGAAWSVDGGTVQVII